jgi:predicted transcriptional regulator
MRTRGPSRFYKYEVSHIETLPRGTEVIRTERFRNQEEVAERFGVSGATVRRWLAGRHHPGWRSQYIIERIREEAVEEVPAESVLVTPLK